MAPEPYAEAAIIACRAADHIARVGRTNDLWDSEQEAAGTPRSACRVNVIGAIAQVAHGNPGERISSREDAADLARTYLLSHLRTHAFTDNLTPTTADAVRVLRAAGASLSTRAGFPGPAMPETQVWCAEREHPYLTYNPWLDRSYCRCGAVQEDGDQPQDHQAKRDVFHSCPPEGPCRCYAVGKPTGA